MVKKSILVGLVLMASMPMHSMFARLSTAAKNAWTKSNPVKNAWQKTNPVAQSAILGAGAVGCAYGAKKALSSVPAEEDKNVRDRDYYSIRNLATHGAVAGGLSLAALRLGRGYYQIARNLNIWQKSLLSNQNFRADVGSDVVPSAMASALCAAGTVGVGGMMAKELVKKDDDNKTTIINGKRCLDLDRSIRMAIGTFPLSVFGWITAYWGRVAFKNAVAIKKAIPDYRAENLKKMAQQKKSR